ncbi:DUF5689 domain-containing protein [Chitinophaga qingshengii]|uniref:DUF5689 domain-containing protein n=1 Tax=Chitinophaga qingshengii TaxID=1569794 RepID=A0ABR7TVE4_9BACT|nr:DUF5689 domain-containing protein [Chitinophaga qingshengii]MBC9934459.1 hypothetical protein [Chitinophaga qingshengii]
MNSIKYNTPLPALVLILLLLVTACKKMDAPDLSPAAFGSKTISISQLKALSTTAEVHIPDGAEGKQITGVVISDPAGKNMDPKTIILQSEGADTAGIVVQLDSISPFNPGDWLAINASGQKLQQQDGEIVLKDIPLSNIRYMGKGVVKVISVSVAEALANAGRWNGTLVRFYDGALSGGSGKYSGVLRFKEQDSSAAIQMQVLPGAVFENTAYPAGVSTFTGILRVHGADPYVQVRNAEDVNSTAVTRVLTDEMHIYGMTNPSPYWENPNIVSGSATLETGLSRYAAGDIVGNIPAFAADAGLLPPQSTYCYLLLKKPTYVWDLKSTLGLTARPGIKEIRVTFMGSQVTGLITKSSYGDVMKAVPFNPATDSFKLALQYNVGSYTADTVSAAYSEAGKLYTAVFRVPSRRELFETVSALDPYFYKASVDGFLEDPKFTIVNYSDRVDPDQDPWGLPASAPVVITKIEYGY